jgi:hypothetical protein
VALRRQSKRSRVFGLLGLVVAIATYAGLSLYQINLPGLHYDEAFEAVPALQLLRRQPVTPFRNAGLSVGQQRLPLMAQDYIGALNTYLAIPFIAGLGATPVAIRAQSILIGIATLALTYGLAYRLTNNPWVGLAAALILAVEPTFVFWNRQGIFVTAVTATIGLGATYCWLRRLQTGLPWWSTTGAFLFGLGLYAKLLFLWLIVALVGAVILLNLSRLIGLRTSRLGRFRRLSRAEIIAMPLAFLLGCWPLIVYNVQTQGTFLSVAQNASTSYYGVNNLAWGENFLERMRQFMTLLSDRHLWYLGETIGSILVPFLFGLVFFIVVILTMRNLFLSPLQPISQPNEPGALSPTRVALFPYLVIGLVIIASIGTVSALWITHFAILMPWPALAIAIGGWYIGLNLEAISLKSVVPYKIAIWLGLVLVCLTNLLTTVRYHAVLTESGGLSSHSDAIYDLSAWLARNAGGHVVAMDWGLAAPITYLTQGQVITAEIFGYEWTPDVELENRLRDSMTQPDTLYLWRAPDEIIFDRSLEFKALYGPLNLEENIEEAFYEKSGRPILGVTRLVEKGTATNPP